MSEGSGGNRHQIERWLIPLLIIVFCVGAYWVTTTFKTMPPILKRGIQPADFPQLLLGVLIVLTLVMVWKDPIVIKEKMRGTTLGTMALFLVFAVLTAIDLFLALGVFAAALALFWGERRAHVLAVIGIAVPLVIFFLFDLGFEIRFPRGLLTNLWYG